MVDIFDEIEEDLRAERAKQFWKRYGGLVLGAAVMVVAGVGAYQGWNWWQTRRTQEAAVAYLAADADQDRARSAQTFAAIAADAPEGYRTLARLREAAVKADTGDLPGALAAWDAVAADQSAERIYRDLASYNWVLRQLDLTDPDRLTARLGPLMQDGAPYRASARELSALIALRAGRPDEAKTTLQQLDTDVTAPDGVRTRARALLSRLNE